MKKSIVLMFSFLVVLFACETVKKVKLIGDWKFESYKEGSAYMTAQQKAVAASVASLFTDSELSFTPDGKISMETKLVGNKKGTYSLSHGELSVDLNGGGKFVVYVMNIENKLVINLGQEDPEGAGQIFFVKK